ncbi:transporter substrate-binding domain-containing protein [Streptococcus sp. SGI.013]|uniref:transporter substrate-binding domain-containing protein n=1 Tax=unclassified Streptococcus TaxID=2608887 RepID=UPI003CFCBC08
MKKVLISLGLAFPLVLGGASASADEKEIVVATAGDIKPFSYESKGQLTGYDIEVLKAADQLIEDYKVTFKKTSWESIFPGLDSGRYQAAANNLSYTEERAKKYLYSTAIAQNPLVLVSRPSEKLRTLSDLAGKTTHDDVGTSTAQLVEEWNKKQENQSSTIVYTGEDIGKRLFDLNEGKFDYLIFDKISIETLIKQKGYDLEVADLKTDLNPNNYIVFSKDAKDFASQFDKAVKKLYAKGELEKLSQTYLGGSYLPEQ